MPHLITDVQTTPAPTSDFEMLPIIQADLAAGDRLPSEHIVDAGYVTAEHLVTSQKMHGVNLLGPVNPDPSWQAKAQQGFEVATFAIDWDSQIATCPNGRTNVLWMPGRDRHEHKIVNIRFARTDCEACPVRVKCTHSSTQPRMLTVRVQEQHEALQAARQRQTTDEFRKSYAKRAGVEGTISQGVRRSDVRHSRYLGLAKTHLQHLVTATALNLLRVAAWLAEAPLSKTRQSPFGSLAPVCA
jgi:transposase